MNKESYALLTFKNQQSLAKTNHKKMQMCGQLGGCQPQKMEP